MFSTRFYTFLFFAIAFGMFAVARPVALTARVDRTISCEDLLAIIVDLKSKILVLVAVLDGKISPEHTLSEIVVLIKAYINILAVVHVDLGDLNKVLSVIVGDVLDIIKAIFGGLLKYSNLDANSASITGLIQVVAELCARISILIPGAFIANILTYLNAEVNLPIRAIVEGLIKYIIHIL